jgi:hypothetical protein
VILAQSPTLVFLPRAKAAHRHFVLGGNPPLAAELGKLITIMASPIASGVSNSLATALLPGFSRKKVGEGEGLKNLGANPFALNPKLFFDLSDE